ncbi:MAG TPA: TOBE domain-containing protein, partial [Anaeromyxobacter sp.]|nr:TOBE domain-containing protein [Anaeromyxobacter sp.]
DEPLTLGLRPEHLLLCKPEEGLRGRVDLIEELGDSTVVYCELSGTKQVIAAKLQGHQRNGLKSGDPLGVRPIPSTSNLFDAGGKALAL